MITLQDEKIFDYLNLLKTQKEYYEQILDISRREEKVLISKPLIISKVIDLLKSKDVLLNQVANLEKEVVPLRDHYLKSEPDEITREKVNCCLSEIGSLLEKLINKDAGNEDLLHQSLKNKNASNVNMNYAMRAYGSAKK